jgi:hypothetical protein
LFLTARVGVVEDQYQPCVTEDSAHPYPDGDTTHGYVSRFQNLPIYGQVHLTFIERKWCECHISAGNGNFRQGAV